MAPSSDQAPPIVEPTDGVAPTAPVEAAVSHGRMPVSEAHVEQPASHAVPNSAPDTSIQSTPPAFGGNFDHLDINQDGFATEAKVAKDGRIDININQRSRRLSNLLAPVLQSHLASHEDSGTASPIPPGQVPPSLAGAPGEPPPPPLNVVMHVVGSRGDVQPFVALGKTLREKYHHRVRLATHPTFRGFVEENGLEFFSIGGDPAELMAFMVKNPSLMPGIETLRNGDIAARRKGMYEIIKGCWRSCIEAGDGMGVQPSHDYIEDYPNSEGGIYVDAAQTAKPFIADAIIANPPSYAHMHCAEKLGIPLHLMFTMPWSPTQAFPHPLANILSSNADSSMTNYISYALVEMMTWQGLGDVINRFREKSLALEPVSLMWAPGMASRLRIPYTYCWSPVLIPKPKDWGPHISVSGFYFLSLASSYQPDAALQTFLDAGPPPVYIGFGSIVVDDPTAMTKMIFEAVKKAGVRALVSKGWGGIGADELGVPDNVFMLGNIPHDWLFAHVSCVVHHGGAGTTAAGVALGRPTVVVPFFGDQPFWGAMIARAGAGPEPVPYKDLDSDKLAANILTALEPAVLEKAHALGESIILERGTEVGARRFHENLQLDQLRCSLAPDRAAVWRVKRTNIRLSAFAATVLGKAGVLDFNDLKFYRPREYEVEDGPWEPISGGATALLGTIGSLMMGVADFPVEILRGLRVKGDDTPDHGKEPVSLSTNHTPNQVKAPSSLSSPTLKPEAALDMDPRRLSSDSFAASSESSAQAATPLSSQTSLQTSLPVPREASPRNSGESRRPSEFEPPGSPESNGHRPTAMGQALSGHLHRMGSGKRSPSTSSGRRRSCSPSGKLPLEAVVGAGRGVGRIVEVGLKSPMDFTLALARGFHNAPKLYGDETVRNPDKVTGIKSGLKTAGKGFGYGFYDGVTGLVTQPIKGAKQDGPSGFMKGLYKGIGGLVLKPGAAIWGLPGYTFRGIYKEIQKQFGSSVHNYIYAARSAQGFEDWHNSSPAERQQIIEAWHSAKLDLDKARHSLKEDARRKVLECKSKAHPSAEERKRLAKEARENREAHDAVMRGELPNVEPILQHAHTYPDTGGRGVDEEQFEHAIKASVAATSRGDPEEDRKIESAIRASVAELLSARGDEVSEPEALDRAVSASVLEASRHRHDTPTREDDSAKGRSRFGTDGASSLRSSLQHSLDKQRHPSAAPPSYDEHDSDEQMQRALEESKNHARLAAGHGHGPAPADDPELRRAIEESTRMHCQQQQEAGRAKAEEDIVLDYIKRQSQAEEEHRKAAAERGA